jgi:long-chain fatty acid transport protein
MPCTEIWLFDYTLSGRIMKTHNLKFASFALALASVSGTGHASGFAITEQNASGLGNAYAGAAAVAEDASTIFFNPAGMTRLPNSQLVAALNGIKPSIKYSDGNSATPDGGDAGDLSWVPNLYFVKSLGPSTWFGIGVNAPFGLKTEYDPGWVGQYAAIKSELKTININPSVATKFTDKLSMGFGLDVSYIDATLTNNSPGGLASVKGDDWGVGANLGLLYEIDPSTRIGLSYRSRIKYKLSGDVSFSGASFLNGPVSADVTLPDIVSLSLVKQLNPAFMLLADVSYTTWSVFDKLAVVRADGTPLDSTTENWDDTWRFSLGATYKINDAFKLRGGLAYDQSPVPDAYRTPRIPDSDRTWVALGLTYQMTPKDKADLGYAHLFVKNGVQPATPAKLLPAGSYESSVDILGIQYTHSF